MVESIITVDRDTYSEYSAKALKYDTLVEAILREKYEFYSDILDYPSNYDTYYKRGVVFPKNDAE